jgi:hypothetical protein
MIQYNEIDIVPIEYTQTNILHKAGNAEIFARIYKNNILNSNEVVFDVHLSKSKIDLQEIVDNCAQN